MDLPSLEDLGDLAGRRVLVRCDLNVPLLDAAIVDDFRIRSAIPTLRHLQEAGAHVTACSHLGRPGGRPDRNLGIEPVRQRLSDLLPGVETLENLRFDPGEINNDPAFVERLVGGYDVYVNDAFGASHRSHASIVGPPLHLPSAAGRLLATEVEALARIRKEPRRPFVALIGGAKVSDKLGVIEALLEVVDELLIGGGMCFTFLAAKGSSVGSSLLETEMVEWCRDLLSREKHIRLPVDVTALGPGGVLGNPSVGGEVRQMGTSLPEGWSGVDIGPGTAVEFADVLAAARTILWNGPMGVFEDERFVAGTQTIAEAIADSGGLSVIGGGDSVAAVQRFGLVDRIDHVSTGGGATLEFIEKGDLPGLAALRGSSGEL